MKKALCAVFSLVALTASIRAIDGDFGRRFGADSTILQEPIYMADANDTEVKSSCCAKKCKTKRSKKKACKKSKNCKCNPCKCNPCKC